MSVFKYLMIYQLSLVFSFLHCLGYLKAQRAKFSKKREGSIMQRIFITANIRSTFQATVDTRWSNTDACLQVNLLLMQISIIIIRQQHLLILVILKNKCLFFSISCQWIHFNIKHWASLSL